MVNKTIIQGRIVRDVELRRTNSGTAVASFTIAWSEKYKEQERKLFLPCVAWGNQAEFVTKWFPKGSELVAEGYLTARHWQDKNGNNRETIELTVDRIHFCGAKKESGANQSENYNALNERMGGFVEDDSDDSLPF